MAFNLLMVLEALPSLQGVEKHPASLFLISFIIATIGIFVAHQTFPESTSVLALAFVATAFLPIMKSLFLNAEEKEVEESDMPFAFIATHFDVIKVYTWIFIGLAFTFSFWAVMLPESTANCDGWQCALPEKGDVFSQQAKVRSDITGNAVGSQECFSSGTKDFSNCFQLIFENNTWVMVLAIIFSFIWGAGAIFLLGWNASVIGYFVATEITSKSLDAGIARAISYLPHGIPEIMAYFIAAIAGGIISAAITKKSFQKHELRIVLVDTVLLLMLATITLFIGAYIETSEIFGDWNSALAGVVAFLALYLVLYVPSVRYRINKVSRPKK